MEREREYSSAVYENEREVREVMGEWGAAKQEI